MFNKVGVLINKFLHQRSVATHNQLPEPMCSKAAQQHNQDDIESIEKLQSEIAGFEYFYGCEYVKQERRFNKHRLVTIAKAHLRKAHVLTKNDWIIESKSLVRYFGRSNESDAAKAVALLMPFGDKYWEARIPNTTVRPKPHGRSMGANREMTTTTGSGNL